MKAAVATLLLATGALAATCRWEAPPPCGVAEDGDCDDGGPGSEYSFCALGTDITDCGPRRLEMKADESFLAVTAERRLSESTGTCPDNDCTCPLANIYISEDNDCGAFYKKSECWKDSSEYAGGFWVSLISSSATEICCGDSSGDCCEPDSDLITIVATVGFILLCAIIGGFVLCCVFLPCCKCCPCNKKNKKGATPSGVEMAGSA